MDYCSWSLLLKVVGGVDQMSKDGKSTATMTIVNKCLGNNY